MNIPRFQGKILSKTNFFYWRDLWDANACLWKDWRSILHEFSLYSIDCLTLLEIISLIPKEDFFEMNIDMPRAF